MRPIYSVLIKDNDSPWLQHTTFFENPPTNKDIEAMLLDYADPKKFRLFDEDQKRILEWAKEIGALNIQYYPSDLKYRNAAWRFGEGKTGFSLTIKSENLYAGTPEKKEETASSYGEFAMNQLGPKGVKK